MCLTFIIYNFIFNPGIEESRLSLFNEVSGINFSPNPKLVRLLIFNDIPFTGTIKNRRRSSRIQLYFLYV